MLVFSTLNLKDKRNKKFSLHVFGFMNFLFFEIKLKQFTLDYYILGRPKSFLRFIRK